MTESTTGNGLPFEHRILGFSEKVNLLLIIWLSGFEEHCDGFFTQPDTNTDSHSNWVSKIFFKNVHITRVLF